VACASSGGRAVWLRLRPGSHPRIVPADRLPLQVPLCQRPDGLPTLDDAAVLPTVPGRLFAGQHPAAGPAADCPGKILAAYGIAQIPGGHFCDDSPIARSHGTAVRSPLHNGTGPLCGSRGCPGGVCDQPGAYVRAVGVDDPPRHRPV